MPLSTSTLQNLEAAKAAVEAWRDREVARLQQDASFLRSVRVSTNQAAEATTEEVISEADQLIEEFLASGS